MAGEGVSPAKLLRTFLQEYRSSRGGAHTHTSIHNPCGAFYIPPNVLDDFMMLYKAAVAAGDENLHMTEKHIDTGPVVIDFDFRFQAGVDAFGDDDNAGDDGDGDHCDHDDTTSIADVDATSTSMQRQYTPQIVDTIVGIYGGLIAGFIDDMEFFDVFVMEKPGPVMGKNNIVKDGLHFVIPEVVTTPILQYLFREQAMPLVKRELACLKLSNKISDVIDEAVIEKNNWQMLGSRKTNSERYSVTRIIRFYTEDNRMEDMLVESDDSVYIDRLSIRNKFRLSKIKDSREEEVVRYEQKINTTRLKQHLRSTIVTRVKDTRTNQQTEEDFKQAQALIGLLCKARAESYNDWIRVGWCLRNIDYKLVDDWISFSRQSSKFKEGDCERYWNFMRQDSTCLGMGTLHLWAKTDNPEEYTKMVGDELRTLIRESCNGSEYDVARVVQRKYANAFAYDCRNKIWYHFRDHRWHLTHDGMSLKMKLPTDVASEYRKAAAHYNTIANATEDTAQRNTLDELVTKLQGIVHKLKKVAFQSAVMTECAMLFNQDDFDDKLDNNTHIIGFNNGVFDLNAMEFREGRPEDFVSLCTRINFVPLEEQTPETVEEVKEFFGKVLPNTNVRDYVLRLFASFLHGNIREERFHVWTGSGCHKIDTPIMMNDGSVKMVQDIGVGDELMGDDSSPRKVLQLYRGRDTMYEIIPTKGDPFVVNKGHVLSLKATNMTSMRFRPDRNAWTVSWKQYDIENVLMNRCKFFATEDEATEFKENLANDNCTCQPGDIIDLTVEKYMGIVKRIGAHNLFLYKVPVEYKESSVLVDPYLFGYWLGDGHSSGPMITTADREVVDYMYECWSDSANIKVIASKGKAMTYDIRMKPGQDTRLYLELKKLGVLHNKHIPNEYMFNSREVRLGVLAGMIDSDGHYQPHTNQFEVTFKSEKLMDDLIRLARSLGFAAYKYVKKTSWTHKGEKKYGTAFRTQIVGEITTIPTKIARKMMARERIKVKNVSVTGFQIREVNEDNFFGFELDGNHRYLMGDFTVTHNSNGKSKCIELYQKAFGDYCCTLPISLLTQKRGTSNAATPELARAKAKRFAVLQEPGENERLNIGLMKEMTGGDKLYARGLYREGTEFKPQFKMILTCNHLPLVPSDDGGTWRRIRVVKFESKFCDNPDPNNPNEFPIDTSLSQRFDEWAEAFMSILIEYHRRLVIKKYKEAEPEEVLECTREYQRRNDVVADFMDNCILKDVEGSLVLVDHAYSDFKLWLKDEGLADRGMRKSDFQVFLERRLGKPSTVNKQKCWKGYRLKNIAADAGEGLFGGDTAKNDDPLES